jgi:hypothetical protein
MGRSEERPFLRTGYGAPPAAATLQAILDFEFLSRSAPPSKQCGNLQSAAVVALRTSWAGCRDPRRPWRAAPAGRHDEGPERRARIGLATLAGDRTAERGFRRRFDRGGATSSASRLAVSVKITPTKRRRKGLNGGAGGPKGAAWEEARRASRAPIATADRHFVVDGLDSVPLFGRPFRGMKRKFADRPRSPERSLLCACTNACGARPRRAG